MAEIDKAIIRLVVARPYLASAVYAATYVPRDGITGGSPAACDKYWRVYYNPEAFKAMSLEEAAGVIAHELWHLLRQHHALAERLGWESRLANIAEDIAINDDLRAEARRDQREGRIVIKAGERWLYPELYELPEGLDEVDYYNALAEAAQGAQGEGNNPAGAASGAQGQGGGQGQESGPDGVPADYAPDCGSGAHGESRPWEAGPPAESGVPGLTESEASVVRRRVAQQIIEQAAKNRGSVPEGLRRWAEGVLEPTVHWSEKLWAAVKRAVNITSGRRDFSWARPHRRQGLFKGFAVPGLVTYAPRVAVIVDTSGSMGDKELAACLAEVAGIIRAAGGPVMVVAADADIHVVKKVSAFRPEQVELLGGGGTDMAAVIERLDRENFDVIICLTDGETPWPKAETRAHLIIGLTQDRPSYAQPPDWAEVVRIGGGR
jgi:predicted metal-dependent peptidase